ncbi:unnamed protein product [Cuscuta campestris]|uniref:CCHC-type domain-containing protein n=1 Tax=Cuscuta campestris TaxID=132261 RepID=A0A484LYC8_9ASTE|nr:unnamed protein product [Cuscuta campestris]
MRAFPKSLGGGVWRSVEIGWTEPRKYSEDLTSSTIKPFEEYSRAEVIAAEFNDKALDAIFGAVDSTQYKLISNCNNAKEAWDVLDITHEGDEEVKTAKYQILMTQYENLRMDDKEKITEFHGRVRDIANQAARLNEPIPENKLVLKVLRSLPKEYDMDVKAIRRSHNIKTMTLDALMGILESIELDMTEDSKRHVEDSLVEQLEDLQEKWAELLMVNKRNVADKNRLLSEMDALKQKIEESNRKIYELEGENSNLLYEFNQLKSYQKWIKVAGADVLDHHALMAKLLGDMTCIGFTNTGRISKSQEIKFVKAIEEALSEHQDKRSHLNNTRNNNHIYYRCYKCREWGHVKRQCIKKWTSRSFQKENTNRFGYPNNMHWLQIRVIGLLQINGFLRVVVHII